MVPEEGTDGERTLRQFWELRTLRSGNRGADRLNLHTFDCDIYIIATLRLMSPLEFPFSLSTSIRSG
jgi:hypothetical protein